MIQKPPLLRTFEKVLRIKNPERCLSALADLVMPSGTGLIPLSERPELVRMIIVLNFFYSEVGVAGVWRFLVAREAPVHVPATRAWCLRINALRAAAYLAAAVKLFPKARLPHSQTRRDAWVARMSYLFPNPLAELDREYKTAVDEMAECLRVYIREHIKEFERAVAAPVPLTPVNERAALVDNVLAKLKEVGDERRAERQERIQRVQQKREVLGIVRGLPFAKEDPRLSRFVDEITAMTPEQWGIVVDRWEAHLRHLRRAMVKLPSIGFDILQGDVYPQEETNRRKSAYDRARKRVDEVLSFVTESQAGKNTSSDFPTVVRVAVYQALRVVFAIDEIVVDKQGERAARTLLTPFAGFITMPF